MTKRDVSRGSFVHWYEAFLDNLILSPEGSSQKTCSNDSHKLNDGNSNGNYGCNSRDIWELGFQGSPASLFEDIFLMTRRFVSSTAGFRKFSIMMCRVVSPVTVVRGSAALKAVLNVIQGTVALISMILLDCLVQSFLDKSVHVFPESDDKSSTHDLSDQKHQDYETIRVQHAWIFLSSTTASKEGYHNCNDCHSDQEVQRSFRYLIDSLLKRSCDLGQEYSGCCCHCDR